MGNVADDVRVREGMVSGPEREVHPDLLPPDPNMPPLASTITLYSYSTVPRVANLTFRRPARHTGYVVLIVKLKLLYKMAIPSRSHQALTGMANHLWNRLSGSYFAFNSVKRS